MPVRSWIPFALGVSTLLLSSCVETVSVEDIAPDGMSARGRNGPCYIKGNISDSGEKIYHMPADEYYHATTIDENAGEKWFCSAQEAEEAGWRRAKL